MRCIPISGRRGSFVSGTAGFVSSKVRLMSVSDFKGTMTQIHESTQRDDVIPILDVDSFDRRCLNPDVIKETRIKGRRLWLITYIRSVDDIIDAMCGQFDRLCVPYHTVDDPDVLVEAIEISDCVIPTIFVSDGKDALSGRDIDDDIRRIERMGYSEYALLDVKSMDLAHMEVESVRYLIN